MSTHKLLGRVKQATPYLPGLNAYTGSVTASLLLQQCAYRYEHNDYKPFYKFKEPCDNAHYRPGDSWTEELGFTRREFDGALKKIGQKITKSTSEEDRNHDALIWYYTDISRLTYYEVNIELFDKILGEMCGEAYVTKSTKAPLPKSTKAPLLTAESAVSTITENTTENTKEERERARAKNSSTTPSAAPNSPSPSSAPPPSPPDDPHYPYSTGIMNDWIAGGDKPFDSVMARLRAYHEDNPGTGKRLCEQARLRMTPEQYWQELEAYVNFHVTNERFYREPTRNFLKGRGSMYGWLLKDIAQNKYNPARVEQSRSREARPKPETETKRVYVPGRVVPDSLIV